MIKEVFNAPAGGTQYTLAIKLGTNERISYVVEHPGSTSTAYTHQVSNQTEQEEARGVGIFVDDSSITIPAKSSAENFGVDPSPVAFLWSRLKLTTSSGTGTIRIVASVKTG